MAAEDPPEKSLFFRIKDCVLTELRRERGEVKEKAPCKSRSDWEWRVQEKSPIDSAATGKASANIEKSSKGSSDQRPTRTNDNIINDSESTPNGISRPQDKIQVGDDIEKNDSAPDKSTDIHSRTLDQCKSARRYYIKMQDPEAPVCCEVIMAVCPPNTRKLQSTLQTREKCHSPGCDERC